MDGAKPAERAVRQLRASCEIGPRAPALSERNRHEIVAFDRVELSDQQRTETCLSMAVRLR